MIEESLKNKEKQFAILRNKHKSALTDLLGEMPESNYAISVNKIEYSVRSEVDNLKEKLKQKHIEVNYNIFRLTTPVTLNSNVFLTFLFILNLLTLQIHFAESKRHNNVIKH